MSGAGVHSGAGAPVRAGILVTGTEVLTGIITDRNGPWLSERLVELGVDAAMIQIVGDRPDDLMNALRFMAASGMALVVTSGDSVRPPMTSLPRSSGSSPAARWSWTRNSRGRSPRSSGP